MAPEIKPCHKSLTITMLSDSPFFPTGYSNQSKLLADYLSRRGHKIHYLANGYQGANIKKAELMDGTQFNYTIYGQGSQPYFADVMSPHVKMTNSDVFFILLDTFMLHGQPKNPSGGWFLGVDTSPATTFFWYPSDGGAGMPVGCDNILRKIDNPVSMAAFGQKQVQDYYNIKTDFIPHGTEPDRFYKMPVGDRDALRQKWGLHDKFVVGVVARNQARKMMDRTIKAFAQLQGRIPEAILLLHCDPNDQAQQWEIRNLIGRYNLHNRVRFTGMNAMKGFDWDQMNEVYNLFDVFFLSTSGEGFGIPIIEAMSCEIPVIATDYTSTQELVKDNKAGYGIRLVGSDEQPSFFDTNMKEYDDKVMDSTLTGSWEVERGLCSVKHAADLMVELYENPELRAEMGRNGRKAVLEKYDFYNVVGPAWEKLFLQRTGNA